MDTDTPITYANPRREAVIADWPLGSNKRGVATFRIETGKLGERCARTTTDPVTHRTSKPKLLTYARKARIVDGDDGHTYIIELTIYGSISVMQSGMQYQQEVIHRDDPRHAAVLALFNETEG